jgi:hypothetical protein
LFFNPYLCFNLKNVFFLKNTIAQMNNTATPAHACAKAANNGI